MLLAFAAVMMLSGGQETSPTVEDRWITASPDRMTGDPYAPGTEDREGASLAWMNAMLLERGHPKALVCGESEDFDPAVVSNAQADALDLGAQVAARGAVMIGAILGPRVEDGPWGSASEQVSRSMYLHLKADDYRGLRELSQSLGDQPSEVE
jgi:hypothetical protein